MTFTDLGMVTERCPNAILSDQRQAIRILRIRRCEAGTLALNLREEIADLALDPLLVIAALLF